MTFRKKRHAAEYELHAPDSRPRLIHLHGRVAWCLSRLIEAGSAGITAHDFPGARIAAYVLQIRKAGIEVATTYERNSGGWTGTHGRYVLTSRVTITQPQDVA